MERTSDFRLENAANDWSRQLRAITAFTESDSEEFKSDLLDMSDDLISNGLDEEEAFIVARDRYSRMLQGSQDDMKAQNEGWIQIRRISLVLSGILVYFFLYYFMHLTSKLLFIKLADTGSPSFYFLKYVYYYVVLFHVLILSIILSFYYFGNKIFTKLKNHHFTPLHSMVSILLIFGLAGMDHGLIQFIKNPAVLSFFFIIKDYTNYSFPFLFITGFIFLSKRYYLFSFYDFDIFAEEKMNGNTVFELKSGFEEDQIKSFKKAGLEENEIALIGLKRKGHDLQTSYLNTEVLAKKSWRELLLVFSGILTYFLLYYFLQASGRIIFTLLQWIKNEPVFSTHWTWFYVVSFHLLVLFFCTSVYFQDDNLVQRLQSIKIKPFYSALICALTILFAFINRIFFKFSRQLIGHVQPDYSNMEKIFYSIQYSFPLLFSICFLILFFTYYRNNLSKS